MRRVLSGLMVFVVLSVFSCVGFSDEGGKVIAYYFHTNARCPSCHKIEQYTQGALQEYFANEIKAGNLVFETVNVEDKDKEHFVEDYQLYTKTVVLSLVDGGREKKYKSLDKVWQLLGSKEKFYDYIKDETRVFLDELSEGNGS